MAFCRECGACLHEDMKFCPVCGAAVGAAGARRAAPQVEYPTEKPRKRRRSLFGRWWFWLLVLVVAAGVSKRGDVKGLDSAVRQVTSTTASTAATAKPSAAAQTPMPTASPTPAQNGIRPEVKDFLDAYEACMNEYADFMQKYANSDETSVVAMMGDYYSILTRYTEFADKMDAFDEDELNSAELAYYLEVTGRVNQKLLSAMG